MEFLIGLFIFCIGLGFYTASIPIAAMAFGGALAAVGLAQSLLDYLNRRH